MKGIIKGVTFSIILSVIILATVSFIRLFFEPNEKIIKFSVWGLICLSIFLGSLLVSKSTDNKKAVKGIITSLLSSGLLILFLINISGIGPVGSLYTLITLCILSGIIGSFAGVK